MAFEPSSVVYSFGKSPPSYGAQSRLAPGLTRRGDLRRKFVANLAMRWVTRLPAAIGGGSQQESGLTKFPQSEIAAMNADADAPRPLAQSVVFKTTRIAKCRWSNS
jgi:hypothetical protein